MSASYRTFFGMKKEAFAADLNLKEIFETDDIRSVQERFEYAVRLGAVALITGEIGSGKSTALRYVASKLHPSEYRAIHITACPGSILEFYRMFLAELHIDKSSTSRAVMIRLIQKEIKELVLGKKLKVVLIVDEASLMRLEVFAEMHTITQFEQDSKPWLPIILAGKNNLIDSLLVSDIHAPGFKDRGQEPSGACKQITHGRIPQSPSLDHRRQEQPV